MHRSAPHVVLCSLAVLSAALILAPTSAGAARFRFGNGDPTVRPAPVPLLTPGGRLGVSDWTQCGVVPTPTGTYAISFQLAFSDGAQGAMIGWSDERTLGKFAPFASRLNGVGNLVSGWGAGGNAIAVSDSGELLVASATDDAGGGFFLTSISDTSFNVTHELYLQHLTSSGSPAAGYPTGGKSIVTGDVNVNGIVADGSGGVFFGWSAPSSTIRIKRLDNTGTVTGGWPAGGIDTGVPDQVNGEPALDGSGGVYLVWSTATDVMIQRFVSTGVSSGWPGGGLVVATPGGEVNPRVVKLSNNDALVAWVDPTTLHVFAMRVNAAGTVDAGWPAGGKQVSTGTGEEDSPELVADAAGGGLVMWLEPTPPFFVSGDLHLQRLTSSGGISAGWAAAGVPLLSTQSAYESSNLVSDGANGAIAAWTDLRNGSDGDIYAQRILAGGTTATGFDADGVAICDATPGDQVFPQIVPDGAGGAIVTWLDYTNQIDAQVHAARLLNDGTVSALASLVDAAVEPGRVALHWYTPDGSVSSATVERAEAGGEFVALGEVLADGAGHLRYEDRTVQAGVTYRYRLAVPDGATTTYLGQVTVRVPATVSFGIDGFRPDPAVGEVSVGFALESAAPARLELLDVAGRRVLAEEVGPLGPGQHVLRLERASSLPAGVYLLRLTQSGRVVSTRSAIVR
jgi:hypothetical protein